MHELDYPGFLSKIHAGWLGKSIGGAIGAPVENHKRFARAVPSELADYITPKKEIK